LNDNLCEVGARDLARRIASYWAAQGHRVSTWIEPIRGIIKSNDKIYVVRSGLIGGLPTTPTSPPQVSSNQYR
jgi:hypothetical protein